MKDSRKDFVVTLKPENWNEVTRTVDGDVWELMNKIFINWLKQRKQIPGIEVSKCLQKIVEDVFTGDEQSNMQRLPTSYRNQAFSYKRARTFTDLFQKCLRNRVFSKKWNIANLVLLLFKPEKPLDHWIHTYGFHISSYYTKSYWQVD